MGARRGDDLREGGELLRGGIVLGVRRPPVLVDVAPVEACELVSGEFLEGGGVGAVDEVGELKAGGARGGQWLTGEPGEAEW